jgi:hypothetical protein
MIERAPTRFLLLMFLLFTAAASPADTTLFVLQREAAGAKALSIADESAVFESPQAGALAIGWNVRGGEILRGRERAADRQVDFYQGKPGPQRELLCTLLVRYFPAPGGWAPRYRLREELFFMRQGERWVPLKTVNGEPSVIIQLSDTLPNVEGYYASLRFGLTTGPTAIDAWRVGPVTVDPLSPTMLEDGL